MVWFGCWEWEVGIRIRLDQPHKREEWRVRRKDFYAEIELIRERVKSLAFPLLCLSRNLEKVESIRADCNLLCWFRTASSLWDTKDEKDCPSVHLDGAALPSLLLISSDSISWSRPWPAWRVAVVDSTPMMHQWITHRYEMWSGSNLIERSNPTQTSIWSLRWPEWDWLVDWSKRAEFCFLFDWLDDIDFAWEWSGGVEGNGGSSALTSLCPTNFFALLFLSAHLCAKMSASSVSSKTVLNAILSSTSRPRLISNFSSSSSSICYSCPSTSQIPLSSTTKSLRRRNPNSNPNPFNSRRREFSISSSNSSSWPIGAASEDSESSSNYSSATSTDSFPKTSSRARAGPALEDTPPPSISSKGKGSQEDGARREAGGGRSSTLPPPTRQKTIMYLNKMKQQGTPMWVSESRCLSFVEK